MNFVTNPITQTGWRFPEADRRPSEVRHYRLSPEELAKYGPVNQKKATIMQTFREQMLGKEARYTLGENSGKHKEKATKDEFIREIKTGGMNLANYKRIAKKYGYADHKSVTKRLKYLIRNGSYIPNAAVTS